MEGIKKPRISSRFDVGVDPDAIGRTPDPPDCIGMLPEILRDKPNQLS
jgi:hypothetical protein